MQAVILAAGRGKRLGAITKKTQKCLVRVAGVSSLERVLRELPDKIDEVIFVVGYHGNKVRKHFGHAWRHLKIKYAEQRELCGSADALHAARSLLRERFLVINGDDFFQKADLEKLLKYHYAILVYDMGRVVKTGKSIIDRRGYLQAIVPDSESAIVNAGAYMLDRRFFSYPLVKKSSRDMEYGLPHTIAAMAKDVRVRTVAADFWMSGGTPQFLAEASEYFEKKDKREKISTCAS